nr:MAG TPA: hypothetical protein [Caudoviricetes sp.]
MVFMVLKILKLRVFGIPLYMRMMSLVIQFIGLKLI